jgi:hypothetical protein
LKKGGWELCVMGADQTPKARAPDASDPQIIIHIMRKND